MRATLFSLLLLTGCQSTPGFHWSMGFDIPPTLNTTNTVHPLPTAMSTTYVVEGNSQVPVVERRVGVYGSSNFAPSAPTVISTRPPLRAETIPTMPTENGPCRAQGP